MKMETPVLAHRGGRIRFRAAPGDACAAGDALARVE
jgi:biotin carboxyl carrier protein